MINALNNFQNLDIMKTLKYLNDKYDLAPGIGFIIVILIIVICAVINIPNTQKELIENTDNRTCITFEIYFTDKSTVLYNTSIKSDRITPYSLDNDGCLWVYEQGNIACNVKYYKIIPQ
jgi:hypothetical protein|tara:strand:+ start:2156 stop:2512 length:357 start_codon:yes stop_codon:yes gene_type:complete